MSRPIRSVVLIVLLGAGAPALAAHPPSAPAAHADQAASGLSKPKLSTTTGSVNVEGKRIDYQALAGTLVLHGEGSQEHEPTAALFYVAYLKRGADPSRRPLTFLYNGGPGSSTVWLHMGAFGPRRVHTADDTHTPPAPYRLVDNAYSLLDVSDLVFIDAPGTGFGRLIISDTDKDKDAHKREAALKERQKQFYGIDPDAHAFAQFITTFLSQQQRWNSPKFLFGESYGTTRSAVLANLLQNDDSVDLNGVIMLSQILNFDTSVDRPETNPGVDLPYVLGLPTYAATAWYHNKLPQRPAQLEPFLRDVEAFALGDYAQALAAGSTLDPARKQAIAAKLHDYTGLPLAYLLKGNLRIDGGEFAKNLEGDDDLSTGRLDTRFAGPTMDPLSQRAEYDPQSAAISSAYVSAFNDYVRRDLKFGTDMTYLPMIGVGRSWSFQHKPPGARMAFPGTPNVMPDLAAAMKYNPDLKVLLNAGYYDLATPYYAATWEMRHLPIPGRLQANISYAYYQSGHMVYVHEPALKQLHDNVARFIDAHSNVAH